MSVFSSIATALPFLMQSVPAIKTGLKGRDLKGQRQTLGAMKPLAQQQTQLAKAQYDPNSEIFQNLYRQEREMGQANIADTIAELSRQNRKLVSMGRSPLLDAERGGESVFRNLVKGQQDVGERARLNTISRLTGAQTALSRAQGAYAPIYEGYGDLSDSGWQNDLTRVGAQYSIGDVLKQLFNLGQQSSDSITWNTPRYGGY